MACANDKFMIIGGSTKSGTTSLFHYLADHPSICPSSTKETRFFLDRDYPLPVNIRFEEGIDKYFSYFHQHQGVHINLESTPDYLYSDGCANRIRASLSDVLVVFILRNPIGRLLSWYGYAKQTNRLPEACDVAQYVQDQLNNDDNGGIRQQHMRALEQGRYASYLEAFISRLGRDRIHVVWFEDLQQKPFDVIEEICQKLNVSADFYDDYQFVVKNKTKEMRNAAIHRAYMESARRMRNALHYAPKLKFVFRTIKRGIDPLYERLNARQSEKTAIDVTVRAKLARYYRDDMHKVGKIVGKAPPWEI